MSEKISAESIPGQGTTFSFTIVAETTPGKQLDLEKADKGTASEGLSGQRWFEIQHQSVLVQYILKSIKNLLE